MESTDTSEDKFNEGVIISKEKYPKFHQLLKEIEMEDEKKLLTSCGDKIRALAEAIEWMFNKVDQLDLCNKDIFLPLGPSRTGKGTLLAAMQGYEMKMFKRSKCKGTAAGKEAALAMFMAPVDPNDNKMPD